MRKINIFLVMIVVMLATSCSQSNISNFGTKWHWDGGTIVVETPERPAG